MKTRINYNEIDEISNYIIKEKDEMVSIFKDIKNDLNDVNKYWKGKDSDTFINISLEYVKESFDSLDDLSLFKDNLNEIVKLYKDSEEKFNKKIKES